jgi:hypothetical protein
MNKNIIDKRDEIKSTTDTSDVGIAKPFLNKIDLFRVYPIQMTAAFVTLFILSAIVIGAIIGVVVLKNKSKQFEKISPGIPELSSILPELITTNGPPNKNRIFREISREKGFAKIYVHSAQLPDSDSDPGIHLREKKSDPYLTITLEYYTNNTFHEENYSYVNRVMHNVNNPIFNINCKTESVPLVNSSLIFRVYDKDDVYHDNKSTDDLIGSIKVSINETIKMNNTGKPLIKPLKKPLSLDISGKNDELNPKYYLNFTIWWTFNTIRVNNN